MPILSTIEEDIYTALGARALVPVESGELEEALKYSDEAIAIAGADTHRLDQLYPLPVKGWLLSGRAMERKQNESAKSSGTRMPH